MSNPPHWLTSAELTEALQYATGSLRLTAAIVMARELLEERDAAAARAEAAERESIEDRRVRNASDANAAEYAKMVDEWRLSGLQAAAAERESIASWLEGYYDLYPTQRKTLVLAIRANADKEG